METKIKHSLPDFVKFHLRLIELEYEEEKKSFDYDAKTPDISKLKRQGVLVNDLTLNEVDSEFGSCIVEFSRESTSKDYCPLLISNGDIVEVGFIDEGKVNVGTGTVVHIGKKIRISLDQQTANNMDHDRTYYIVKTTSEITYKRMKSALQSILNHDNSITRCHMIVQHLFKNVPLETATLHSSLYNEDKTFKFINNNLHQDQKESVLFALQQRNLAIIHGPPGTGKTTTLVEIISQLVGMEQKVLVCAPSNIAVDTILEKLSSLKNRVIRLGKTARMMDSIKNYSLDAVMLTRDDVPILKDTKSELEYCLKHFKEVSRNERYAAREYIKSLRREVFARQNKAQRELMNSASVVLTTLTSASDDGPLGRMPDQYFDVVVIDECSQAIEAACWIAIPKAPKLILAGDHLQLPPTVKSKHAYDKGLSVSLMERAIATIGKNCYKLLTQQFRMHLSIMSWVSKLYDDKLKADESVADRLLRDLSGVSESDETESPLCFIDTAGCKFEESEFHGSKCNENEADVVCIIIKRLIDAGVNENVISVITPYSLQVSCINKKLKYPRVEVRTVDGFQGREKEAIVISFVRSNKEKELGFVSDKRRLNVAVSRAKCFLAVVGDSTTVGSDDLINSLIKHIRQHGSVVSAHELYEEINAEKLPEFMSTVIKKANKERSAEKECGGSVKVVSSILKPEIAAAKPKPKFQPAYERKCAGDETEKKNLSSTVQKKRSSEAIQSKSNFEKETHTTKSSREKKKQTSLNELQSATTVLEDLNCSDSEDEKKTIEMEDSIETKKPGKVSGTVNSSKVGTDSKTKKSLSQKRGKILKKQNGDVEKHSNADDDEDNKFLDNIIQKSSVCSMTDCKTSVNLISHYCEYCRMKYCLSHMLPEIHGCTEEVRRSSRHNFKHQVPHPTEKEKKIANAKFKKKMTELAAERKGGSKKK